MSEAWPPGLLVLAGVVVYAGAHHLLVWLGGHDETLHVWAAAWCGDTLLFLLSRYLQVTATTADGMILGARLSWLSGLGLVVILIGWSHALAGSRPPPLLMSAATALSLGLSLLVWFSPLILTTEVHARTDVLGHRSLAPVLGPLVRWVVLYTIVVCVRCFATVWRSPQLSRTERSAILAGFAIYTALLLNDLLYMAGLMRSLRLFDIAFVGVAVGLSWMLARRYNVLTARLRGEVEARTAQLTALLGAAKSIATGLDLPSTLQRIVEEAARISGGAHVTILLLDDDTRLLRPAASSGLPFSQQLGVPLGARYSGIVAATGRPLFIADTQADPLNPMIEQHRRLGIRTYLGLPIRTGERAVGVLSFNTEDRRVWREEEIAYLESFADQAAIALANARLYATESAARREAQVALAQVKQLHGLLPICAWCKRVRNDANYWEQIESYIAQRSEATFSHGICPDCRAKVQRGL
jgi:hypothetical protein